MTLREFIKTYEIVATDMARACEIDYSTFRTYIGRHRTPNLRAAIKIVHQTGGIVTLEDLLRKDQPLMRLDNPLAQWKPRKLKTSKRMAIAGDVRKKHYRKIYFHAHSQL